MTPSVSVVVPARNAAATLPDLLEALRRQEGGPAIEVVVVDDGSTDDTAGVARHGGAHVIRQENRGPAAARNRGWREAGGDVVLFTDSDCVPRRDWVRTLAAVVGKEAPVACGTYGIANPESHLARVVHAEIRWRHARLGPFVDFAGSFNFGATRAALESVGGFDESFTAPSGEDNDLSYRLRDAGHRIRFVPEAVVDHHHPHELGRYLREQSRHGEWRTFLYLRHPRRSRGDDYAGPADFAAPVLAVASGLLVLLSPLRVDALGAAALCFALVVLLNNFLALSVARRSRSTDALSLVWIGTLRAYARGLGMVRGFFRGLGGRR